MVKKYTHEEYRLEFADAKLICQFTGISRCKNILEIEKGRPCYIRVLH